MVTWQPAKWSSTIPVACISAYAVVGPTNRNPWRLSVAAIARDSGMAVGTSAEVAGQVDRGGGANDHSSVARPSGSANAARALWMAASILARLRTMPGLANSRATSASP